MMKQGDELTYKLFSNRIINNIINVITNNKGGVMRQVKSDLETQMRRILGLYILKILRQGPAYGNKLSIEIKQRTQDAFTPNTNALYPLLRKMEERGYITGEWESPDTRSKRIYTITDTGVAHIPELELKLQEQLRETERRIAILRADLLT
jgi:DNA-binding PadR family transcriptional regulator